MFVELSIPETTRHRNCVKVASDRIRFYVSSPWLIDLLVSQWKIRSGRTVSRCIVDPGRNDSSQLACRLQKLIVTKPNYVAFLVTIKAHRVGATIWTENVEKAMYTARAISVRVLVFLFFFFLPFSCGLGGVTVLIGERPRNSVTCVSTRWWQRPTLTHSSGTIIFFPASISPHSRYT